MRIVTRRLRCGSPARRLPRGQTLVIAALVMLVVVVAVFLTFAIGHRTREKIKLQAMADASAYSLAVAEARAFNFYAFANRAHVAHDVSVLSIHAHHSYLSWYEGLLKKTADAFSSFQRGWRSYCRCLKAKHCWPKCPTSCRNQSLTSSYADMFRDSPGGHQWVHDLYHGQQGQLAFWDQQLAKASVAHRGLISSIVGQQRQVQQGLRDLMAKQTLATRLSGAVDPAITGFAPSDGVSLGYYDDAVGQPEQVEDWLEIVHGTRYPGWITGRRFVAGSFWSTFASTAQLGAIPDWLSISVSETGGSKTLAGDPSDAPGVSAAVENSGYDSRAGFGGAHAYGSEDHGGMRISWFAIPACLVGRSGSWRDAIYSEPPEGPHYKSFHTYEGGQYVLEPEGGGKGHGLGGCDEHLNCGIYQGHMRYKLYDGRRLAPNRLATASAHPKLAADREELWYQPHTVAVVTKPQNSGQPHVWDFDWRSSFPFPQQFTTTRSRGDALGGPMAAIAGGLVYYHKPTGDSWREPPNLWNPFWRAKLHPLRPDDAARALERHPAGRLEDDFKQLMNY